jgi:hypothetical protein
MAEFRYKAFISYCHKDEAWAKWLHRALESYRVPRKLVGKQTSAGEVAARIRPVFRDRDDLSSLLFVHRKLLSHIGWARRFASLPVSAGHHGFFA